MSSVHPTSNHSKTSMAKSIPLARRRLILAFLSLIILLPTTLLLQNRTPKCQHAILFSAPYHGSSWFLNSLEGCKYPGRIPRKINTFPNSSLTPSQVARLLPVQSVRIYPLLDDRTRKLLSMAGDAPVVVLRRDVASTYRSFLERGGKMEWEEWEERIDDYFGRVATILKDERVQADWVSYNNVFRKRRIWLHRSGCHIDNCEYSL